MCKVCFLTCKDTHYIDDDQKKCAKYLEILQILAIFAGKFNDLALVAIPVISNL